jgi:hypothetical protein
MLVKSQVEYNLKDYENSLATSEAAFEIPGIKEKTIL